MQEVELSEAQKKAAESIISIEGPIIYAYDDEGCIHMETESGKSPWKWIADKWEALECPWWDVKGS